MIESVDILIVDAFTPVPFKGNPAGVCILDHFPVDTVMQNIATELGVSETAFLAPVMKGVYSLRWFTPACEVDICGHGTLAAAHALREKGILKFGESITFDSRSGELGAHLRGNMVELDFPLLPGNPVPVTDAIRRCLGVPILRAEHNGANLLVEIESMEQLRFCQPHMEEIAKLEGTTGLIVTTANGCGGYDFASRYFAPQIGVLEDPVTGSAHCFLAAYWAPELGKSQFRAFQASSRTGVLELRVEGDRLMMAGDAVTVLRGAIQLGERHAAQNAA